MVYGDFLQSDDPRLHYNRKVLGILALHTVGTLALTAVCAKLGLFNDLAANYLTFAAAAFATIGGATMLVINVENRIELPKAHFLLAAFIIGSAFLVVDLSQGFSDQFVLLILWALAAAVTSLFIPALIAKNKDEAEWYMQIGAAAGGAITTLLVPFFLNTWYGEDYSMLWVLWTVIFNVLVAYYIYYDLLVYQGDSLIEDNDYIFATLRVYYDWIFIVTFAFLRCCWRKATESSE